MAERKDRRRPLFPLALLDFPGGSRKGDYLLRHGFLGDDVLEVVGSDWQLTVDRNTRISADGGLLMFTDNLAGLSVAYSRAYGNLEAISFQLSFVLKKARSRGGLGREDRVVLEKLGGEAADVVLTARCVDGTWQLVLTGLFGGVAMGRGQDVIRPSALGALPGQPDFSWWSDLDQLLAGRVGIEVDAADVVASLEKEKSNIRCEFCRIRREVSQVSRFDLARTSSGRMPTKAELEDLMDAIFGLK